MMRGARRNTQPAATIRMYRQGLGDCFLLTIARTDGTPFRLLVDCGVVLGASGKREGMKAIAADIASLLGEEKVIDVLVLTHEHYDHAVGFELAKEIFQTITFNEIWMAWTEDEADPLARRLRDAHSLALDTFDRIHRQLVAFGAEREAHGLMATLFGGDLDVAGGDPDDDEPPDPDRLFEARRATTAGSFETAKNFTRGPRHYLRPHTLAELPDDVPARIFILGPPYDEAKIGRSAPSETDPETFGVDAMMEEIGAVEGWLETVAGDRTRRPFEAEQEIPYVALKGEIEIGIPESVRASDDDPSDVLATRQAFFRQNYFAPHDADGNEQSWRRIDGGLLSDVDRLALHLDAHTNNTSLAFAVQLGDGRVLLFPGDAQVGNCLSWHDQSFEIEGETVTVEKLLRETVFYKVSHHGSHNGTLRQKGLDMMERLQFAAIPVNKALARRIGWTAMPLPELVEALDRRVHANGGLVLQSDEEPEATDELTVTPNYFELRF